MTPAPDGSPPTGWGEVLDKYEETCRDGHERLRKDLERTVATLATLTSTVERNYRYFEDQSMAMRLRLATVEQLAQRPIDGTAVVWTTKALAVIFSAALAITSVLIWVKYDLATIHAALDTQNAALAKMEKQREDDRKERDQRLSDFLNQRLETELGKAAGAAKGPVK